MSTTIEERPTRAALNELLLACEHVDGLQPFGGHVLEEMDRSTTTQYVQVVLEGTLAALLVLPLHDPAEPAVHPAHRRRGIGSDLLRRALRDNGRVWAHGDLPTASSLAGRHDLVRVRELLQLRRGLEDLPAVVLPDGVRLRSFVPGADDPEFLAVNRRAFAWHPEQSRLDQAGLDLDKAQPWFDSAGFLLAVDESPAGDGRILGFHWTKVHAADPTPRGGPIRPVGEVYVLGVDPLSPVRRLGTPLTVAGLRYLAGKGLGTALLYAEGDNQPALTLYTRLGFQAYQRDIVYAAQALGAQTTLR